MEPFIGQIIMFGGNFAPRGWALCDGQLLDIASHTALFSILGTIYGGDGRTTFGLPDLRSRSPVHQGNGPGLPPINLGAIGGNPTTTLNTNNLPSHTHVATATHDLKVGTSTQTADADDPDGGVVAAGSEIYFEGAPDATMADGSVVGNVSVTNSNVGNGVAFNNYHPYQAVNFIIALVGTFPSRN